MLSGKRQLLRLPAIRFFSPRLRQLRYVSRLQRPGAQFKEQVMSWRDAQTLTLYRADADPASREAIGSYGACLHPDRGRIG